MNSSPSDQSTETLPALRQDIEIVPGPRDRLGAPQWIVHDPLQARYFQISETARLLIENWEEGKTAEQFLAKIARHHNLTFSPEQLSELLTFLSRSNLVIAASQSGWSGPQCQPAQTQKSIVARMFHAYLYVRIPILKPHNHLVRGLPWVEPFFHPWTAVFFAVIAVLGLYLTSRQWDQFSELVATMLSLQGGIYFVVALLLIKALHELGHAFAAVRCGCRVPTMGVALILLMPLLYTDVSDAWRLPSRKQRLAIGAAGVVVELALAASALLLWSFLPEGQLQAVAVAVATTGVVVSLGFNLNPFMKFDGYYLLGDALGIENLHARAFAMGRWKLRQLVLAPELSAPEQFSPGMARFLVVFAWLTWAYRLIVFTAIALLIYHYCFKALGLILLAAELWFFVISPVVREVADWSRMTPQSISGRRISASGFCAVVLIAVLAFPWWTSVHLPAVLEAREVARIYPPQAARIVSVDATIGQRVNRGDIIARLEVPRLDHDIEETAIRIDQLTLRVASSRRSDLDEALVLRSELAAMRTRLQGLLVEQQELIMRAPMSGTVVAVDRDAHAGRWIKTSDRLALVAADNGGVVRAYLSEADHWRIDGSHLGQFVPDDLTRPSVPVTLSRVSTNGVDAIELRELAAVNNGPIAVKADGGDRLVPTTAQYLVELIPANAALHTTQVARGVVTIEGRSESVIGRLFRSIATVAVRESGF